VPRVLSSFHALAVATLLAALPCAACAQGAAKPPAGKSTTAAKTTPKPAPAPRSEWRGVWITRFEWTSGTGAEIKARIKTMMSSLGRGNFNAVVFQVRGQGDTLYPSKMEPWSTTIPADLRKEDPVALAIKEAHKNKLEFHAWLNLLVIWQSREKRNPSDMSHPFYRMANPKDPKRAQGVVYKSPGVPLIYGDSDYVWLTPGNPAVEVYARQVTMDFIELYAVDGLHWDDRTAMPNGESHDPVSLSRFRGRGNPDGIKSLREWQRDQLTRMLSNIYVAATTRRPGILISASPFGIYDKTRIPDYGKYKDCVHDFNTDGEAWLELGIIDVLMPQIYWKEGPPGPSYSTLVRDWMRNNKSGRPIWPGSALGNYGGTQPLQSVQSTYVELTRKLNAGGNTYFSYTAAKDSEWVGAAKYLYPSKAHVPKLSFKTSPRTGQIMGHVKNSTGAPVMDAWVRISGRRYTYLSSADGFFAMPSIPPGKHSITFEFEGGMRMTREVTVSAGKTATLNVTQPVPQRPPAKKK
jgi:uncharacterized lipoprotein YddW (UPF0748 family)